MADLLALSARYIDEGLFEGPKSINRIGRELSEVAEGIAVVESFSHVVAFRTDAGLVLFDTSLEVFGEGVRRALRGWSDAPVDAIAFTHGHVDHVGGAGAFLAEAVSRGWRRPRVIGHENVAERFARYELTRGYNAVINQRQFGQSKGRGAAVFGPEPFVLPDTTFREAMSLRSGDEVFELRHAKGETDDHLWAWIPSRRAICTGDFLIWVFPNAGNPQKAQRYPLEWAAALREMRALEPELLLPAHGLPIAGRERIARVLDDTATALEAIVEATLALMNEGARLDEIVQAVRVPKRLLEQPYLRPVYDEPEFVVRNVWRLYGGWYDGNPAHLKPAPEAALAAEVAALAGGTDKLTARARELADAGRLRLACHLVEMAAQAAPDDAATHAARAEIYQRRCRHELSLMSRGIYASAARESEAKATREEAGGEAAFFRGPASADSDSQRNP